MTEPRDTFLPGWAGRNGLEQGLRRVVVFGLFVLVAGMAVFPIGNHIYQYVFLPLFVLPTLLLVALRPSSVKSLWQKPVAKWVLLLLAWSILSVSWSHGDHITDWVARPVGIALFLYAWVQVFSGHTERIHKLLFFCSAVFAVAAVVLFVLWHIPAFHEALTYRGQNRLMGIGRLGHPNLAAAAMTAAMIWMLAYPCERLWQHLARALMVFVFLVFISQTDSRSTWGGLYLALLVIAACKQGKTAKWALVFLILLGIAALVVAMPELTSRGWSSRPAILEHAWAMFLQHPLIGVGQATLVRLHLATFVAPHAHNLFVQLGVQLGLLGLIVWLGVWLALGWRGWLYRHTPLGCLVLATWVFTTFAGQFALPHMIDSPDVEWLVTWVPLAASFFLEVQPGRGKAGQVETMA